MKEDKQLEQLLEQMSDLTETIYKNRSKTFKEKLPENIDDQLELLEMQVQLFQKATNKALKESGEDEESLKAAIKSPPSNLSRKEKALLERSEKLKKEAITLEKQYAKQAELLKIKKKRYGKKGTSTGKARKRKFKRLGSKKGWKPI